MKYTEAFKQNPNSNLLQTQTILADESITGCEIIFEKGAGGEESGIFLLEVAEIYVDICKKLKFKCDRLSSGRLTIYSKLAYQIFVSETGVHRVQRVPKTEQKGRIQTSTIGIFVNPTLSSDKCQNFKLSDCRIDTYRASGKGGQNVNKVETAVRVVHTPTNTVVTCQDNRDQASNKQAALCELQRRLKLMEVTATQEELTKNLRSKLGTIDRSLKVRTYDFKNNQIVDHRFNLKEGLEQFLDRSKLHSMNFVVKVSLKFHMDNLNKTV